MARPRCACDTVADRIIGDRLRAKPGSGAKSAPECGPHNVDLHDWFEAVEIRRGGSPRDPFTLISLELIHRIKMMAKPLHAACTVAVVKICVVQGGVEKKFAPTATVAVGATFFQRPLVVYDTVLHCTPHLV